jgi:hypothetical protein
MSTGAGSPRSSSTATESSESATKLTGTDHLLPLREREFVANAITEITGTVSANQAGSGADR